MEKISCPIVDVKKVTYILLSDKERKSNEREKKGRFERRKN